MDSSQSYDPWDVQASTFPADGSLDEQVRFLLRYAILAPSTHNSQPWEFAVDDGVVRVFADESRHLEVADADERELFFSVGCAVENLLVAADHFGFETTVDYDPGGDSLLAARVDLWRTSNTSTTHSDRFAAITERRTNHSVYRDRQLPDGLLDELAATIDVDVVSLVVADESVKEEIAKLQARADEAQFDDPAYRAELGRWIGSGALGATWLTARVGQLAVTHLDLGDREAVKNSRLLRSAPVVSVVETDGTDRASRVAAGRVFEHLWLIATAEGVAIHPMNQILQVPHLKGELADLLDVADESLQLLFRLGYAASEEKRRPRRPVSESIRH